MTLREAAKKNLPAGLVSVADRALFRARQFRVRAVHLVFRALGYNVAIASDYYSTLPVLGDIEKTEARWSRPSSLTGVQFDVAAMEALLRQLHARWSSEYTSAMGDYEANQRRGFGPGYPSFDCRVLFYLLREWKPRRYFEIGSGLSTFYAREASLLNARDGKKTEIVCVEPYPGGPLEQLSDVRLIRDVAQNMPLATFQELESGDVLFIDSSHALKIDSDVAYLMLEVLPSLKPGVIVQIHDVPFPFNVPFPPSTWIFGERWPVFWNEAMVVQAFLAFNLAFNIVMSTPLIRHFDETFLRNTFDDYVPLARDDNPPSALWLKRSEM